MRQRFVLRAAAIALAACGALAGDACAAPASVTPERVVSMRQRILSRERYVQLRDEWKAFTDAHPRDPLGWAQLARASSYAGTPCDEYVKYARKAVQLGPDNAEACATLGRYAWGTYCDSQPDDPSEAMRLLQHALALDPTLDDPHYILWTMLQSKGRPAEANAHLKSLLDRGRMPEPLVDLGYNLLVGLEPNAILLTNGDNDTYPLVALQTARGVRTDVAVVNLSLLNLEWFRRQLHDGPLAVPVPLLEKSTKDIRSWEQSEEAVKGLLENLARDGWKRPLYASVTVGELEKRVPHPVSLEGLVYRVLPGEGASMKVDVDRVERNFDEVYRLQSLRSVALDWDDWSAMRVMAKNYGSAMFRLAPALAEAGRLDDARRRMAWMLDLAHFHRESPTHLDQLIDFWAKRDPKCPDLDRWREDYAR